MIGAKKCLLNDVVKDKTEYKESGMIHIIECPVAMGVWRGDQKSDSFGRVLVATGEVGVQILDVDLLRPNCDSQNGESRAGRSHKDRGDRSYFEDRVCDQQNEPGGSENFHWHWEWLRELPPTKLEYDEQFGDDRSTHEPCMLAHSNDPSVGGVAQSTFG